MKNIQPQLPTLCFPKSFFLPLSILVEIVQTLKLARDTQIGHGESARTLEPLQHTPNACRLRPWVREHRGGVVGLPAGAGGPSGPRPHPAAHVSTLLEEEGALQRTVSPRTCCPGPRIAGGGCDNQCFTIPTQRPGPQEFHFSLAKKCSPSFKSFLMLNVTRE